MKGKSMSNRQFTVTTFFVECDVCFETGPESVCNQESAIEQAQNQGWQTGTVEGDVCPECQKRRANHE